MGKTIIVTPDTLRQAASFIDQQATDYQTTYKSIFNEVDGMGSAWQGKDNLAFVNQIKGFEEDLQKMQNLMLEYSAFLKKAAEYYVSTQNEIEQQARRLTN